MKSNRENFLISEVATLIVPISDDFYNFNLLPIIFTNNNWHRRWSR